MEKILVLVIFMFSSAATFAQSDFTNRKNVIFTEGGGAFAAGIGLGYERYFANKDLTRFTARGGAGLIENFSSATFFGGTSFLFGKKFQAEAGLNYITRIDKSNFKSLDNEDRKITNGLQPLIGFRYQNWSNGLLLRIFYVPPVGPFESALPYGGASFGFAF